MILGLGDCNMGGADTFKGENYLDIMAKELKLEALNCAITMSTTQEGKILFDEHINKSPDIVVVAYGLVDSWKTFRYAPYVLYYPDNTFRKIARKLVKKYKKIARSAGLNKILGEKYVVSPQEYKKNLIHFAQRAKRVLFIETPPHLTETFRNPDIEYYNQLMQEVAKEYKNSSVVKIYDYIKENYYLDDIHFNQEGYNFVAQKILEQI